ncbi:MAG TPA: Ni/Fe hydrogenase subunit alpha [Patescibacteria group bacterium]|nr:Ni/Fe hydrogenase subunit alpha [Patescibacteria group bacterium]
MHTFDLSVDEISKIEGKARLSVVVKDDVIEKVQFSITEFKRFYTQAIRGKDVAGVPQLTARICGTCSNAHLLCAIKAIENALQITPSDQTVLLRKLLNYGLIIRDHALHLYFFALPDIIGVDSLLDLDENNDEYHQILHDVFEIKSVGNALGKTIGGRSVHAPFVAVGGFTRLPDEEHCKKLIAELEALRPTVLRTITLFQKCTFALERKIKYVSLKSNDFNFLDGVMTMHDGSTLSDQEYSDYLTHVVIPHSHASGYTFQSDTYMVGALARLNNGKDTLHPTTKKDVKNVLSLFPSLNIYHNNLAQALEILHAVDSSLDILKTLTIAQEAPQAIIRKKSSGIGIIEAPRGILFYSLSIDETGKITTVRIVVPTGQNQIGIEKSIREYLTENLHKDKQTLIGEIEQIIRAYDPCMSCASHFLKVSWKKKHS